MVVFKETPSVQSNPVARLRRKGLSFLLRPCILGCGTRARLSGWRNSCHVTALPPCLCRLAGLTVGYAHIRAERGGSCHPVREELRARGERGKRWCRRDRPVSRSNEFPRLISRRDGTALAAPVIESSFTGAAKTKTRVCARAGECLA